MTARTRPRQTVRRAASALRGWTSWLAMGPDRPRHRVIVNSLPKSGTTLVAKALTSMPGLHPMGPALTGRNFPTARPGQSAANVGVDWPTSASTARLRARLLRSAPGSVILAHLPHSQEAAEVLASLDIRMLVVIRDPRDVAVSLPPYVMSHPEHFLHDRFAGMDEDARVLASIRGLGPDASGLGLLPMSQRVHSVCAWHVEPISLVIRFEDIVGPRGGGTTTSQRTTLRRIAEHVGVELSDDVLARIADTLFGGTSTFRRGQAGGWRQALRPQHRAAVRQELTDVLMELGYETEQAWGW